MAYEIADDGDLVLAQLAGRETVEEMIDFLRAVARYGAAHSSFLLWVRASKPIFQLEQHGLITYLTALAASPSHKIALLADTLELHLSHEYFELIARQHALNVRSFRSAGDALRWLREKPSPDRV